MHLAVCLSAVALMAAPVFADHHGEKEQPAPGQEQQTYRFGATYNVTSAQTVTACQDTCGSDTQCQAWSYIQPLRSAPAYCELKRAAGEPEHNPASISGLSPRLMKAFYGNDLPAPDDKLLGGDTSDAAVIATAPTPKPIAAVVPVMKKIQTPRYSTTQPAPVTQPMPVSTDSHATSSLRGVSN